MKKMNIYQIIIAVITVGIGGLGIMFLRKKGITASSMLKTAETGLDSAETIIQMGESLITNKSSKILSFLNILDKLVLKATKAVQQLYISSQLPAEQRKDKAIEIITEGLKTFDIKITPAIEKIIDASVEEIVLDSKTPEEQRNQRQDNLLQQVSQLQAQVTQLTAEKTNLENQKLQLEQQIQTISSAVQTPQNTNAIQTV